MIIDMPTRARAWHPARYSVRSMENAVVDRAVRRRQKKAVAVKIFDKNLRKGVANVPQNVVEMTPLAPLAVAVDREDEIVQDLVEDPSATGAAKAGLKFLGGRKGNALAKVVDELDEAIASDKTIYRGTLTWGNKNFFEKVTKDEVRLFPEMPGRKMGHPHLNVRDHKVIDILNNPERVFTGRNKWGNHVDVYYKQGSVVITDAGKKTDVITAYGRIEGVIKHNGRRVPAKDVLPDQWYDPFYKRRNNDGVMEVRGWNQQIGERYAEIDLTDPNHRINQTQFPLYDYTEP